MFARYFFFVFIVLSSGILSVRNADLESTDRPKMVGFFFVTCSFSARRCSFLGCLLGARMSTWYLIRATQDSAIYHRPHVFSHFSPLSREGESRSGITRSEVSVLKLLLRVLREAWPEPALFLCSPRPPVFAHIPAGKRVHVEMKRLRGAAALCLPGLGEAQVGMLLAIGGQDGRRDQGLTALQPSGTSADLVRGPRFHELTAASAPLKQPCSV